LLLYSLYLPLGVPNWTVKNYQHHTASVAFNRVHTSVNRSRCSIRWRGDHKRRILVYLLIICKREQFLSLKTLSFLHSHSDHIMANAPICTSIPWSQFPKILTTLVGGYKLDATWMSDHIVLAKRQLENKWLIVSSRWQNTHWVLPCQFRLTRLSLVRITPRSKYHPIFCFLVVFFSFKFSCYYLPEYLTG
jgi:hypothetical protein